MLSSDYFFNLTNSIVFVLQRCYHSNCISFTDDRDTWDSRGSWTILSKSYCIWWIQYPDRHLLCNRYTLPPLVFSDLNDVTTSSCTAKYFWRISLKRLYCLACKGDKVFFLLSSLSLEAENQAVVFNISSTVISTILVS